MARQAEARTTRGPGTAALWGAWALAGAAWALHLGISYGTVEWYCHTETGIGPETIYWVLNITTIIAASLALLGIALAWRNARGVSSGTATTREGAERRRFMAVFGIMVGLLSLSIILVQGLPNFFLEPCQ